MKRRCFPLSTHEDPPDKAHGRIEQRSIAVLPAMAIGDMAEGWAGLAQIACVLRSRQVKKGGIWQKPYIETVYLISSLSAEEASPKALLDHNRGQWRIENLLHRHKDVLLREDGYTNRKRGAPRNIASCLNLTLTILANTDPSPTKALEYFQNNINRAITMV